MIKNQHFPPDEGINARIPLNLSIMQGDEKDWLFEQRETQKVHTAYEWEQSLFSCIQEGDITRLEQVLKYFTENPVMVGRLSNNSLRQMQYLAVAFVTLATRSAIQGGMFEMDAYNKSDACIQLIDQIESVDKVVEFIITFIESITLEMNQIKIQQARSKPIKECLAYIYQNLHYKISLKSLAAIACLSPEYLSTLFKKEVGMSISAFILEQKIQAAKTMLAQDGLSAKDVSNYLNFSSQSHFISSFKRVCGVTPYHFRRFQMESNK